MEIGIVPTDRWRAVALLTRGGVAPTQRGWSMIPKVQELALQRIMPKSERVAQAVEHVTFNHGVEGSSPSALTKIQMIIN